jgi:hypothetical protein
MIDAFQRIDLRNTYRTYREGLSVFSCKSVQPILGIGSSVVQAIRAVFAFMRRA